MSDRSEAEETGTVQSSDVTEHRETFADDSPRGEKYNDDRTALAYAYEGEELLAIAYKTKVVEEWLDGAWFDVSLTPAGEARIDEAMRGER